MKQNIVMTINQWKKLNYFLTLVLSFMIGSVVSGCSVNRISLMSSSPTGSSIQENEVKIYASFKDIEEPWKLEGMICNWHAPLMHNTPKNREEDLRNAAAKLGANAVIGLNSNVGKALAEALGGDSYAAIRTLAILAKTGSTQENNQTLPKFIVCLPPVNFNIEKTSGTSNLNDLLLDYIQLLLGYGKGYYAYRSNAKDINSMSILNGTVDATTLHEPLGIAPHYALLCDVNGYDQKGNIVTGQWQSLEIALTLYDLEERKAIWTCSTEGESFHKSILFNGLIVLWVDFVRKDLDAVLDTVDKATETLPVVKGFQKGGGYLH